MKYRLLLILGFIVCTGAYGASPPVILVLGDSLSSAHGLAVDQGWVNLLQLRLAQRALPHRVVNASISGDTTANALSRLASTLEDHRPDIVIVEIGGNDGLRAQSVTMVRDNLKAIIENVQGKGARVLLAGMRLPPNYGPAYVGQFERIYPELAQVHGAALVPFFMDGVATHPELMQADGMHPNEAAQPTLLDNVWQILRPMLE